MTFRPASFMLLLFLSVTLCAQEFPYTLNYGPNLLDYQPLSAGADTLNPGVVWDDPTYSLPIGFDFPIMGETMNTVSSPGFVGAFLGSGEAISPLIIPYGADIADRGLSTGTSQSPILYETRGVMPNRIFIIEWQNAGFYNELTEGNNESFINVQLWLYESGVIEVCFGPSNIVNNDDIFDGLNGPLIGFITEYDVNVDDFNTCWYLQGEPTSPTVGSLQGVANYPPEVVISGHPPADFLYQFVPMNVSGAVDRDLSGEFRVFPNPVMDELRLEWRLEAPPAELRVQLFNARGQLVQQADLDSQQVGQTTFSVANLPAGTYTLMVVDEGQEYSQLIIKQ
ncbi:MAG: T9SS type A sorting domain-containing protein [Lewinella sp.]|nr:T9SS type A sorting domain-containing protein [Lewinella sp.]